MTQGNQTGGRVGVRINKGDLELARSAVRIARRRCQEYYLRSGWTTPDEVQRVEALLRRALWLLAEDPQESNVEGYDG